MHRILIVYENERIRLGMQDMFNETESLVHVVASKEEALAKILQEPFDLAIVDRTLIEGLGGRQFKERVKKSGASVFTAAPETAWGDSGVSPPVDETLSVS